MIHTIQSTAPNITQYTVNRVLYSVRPKQTTSDKTNVKRRRRRNETQIGKGKANGLSEVRVDTVDIVYKWQKSGRLSTLARDAMITVMNISLLYRDR